MKDKNLQYLTVPHSQKKLNSEEAINAILKMRDRRAIDTHEVNGLLACFMPPRPKKVKSNTEWVCRVAGVDDAREYLNYCYVESGVMYASDGNRLHWTATKMSDGFYDTRNFNKIHKGLNFPRVHNLIPKQGEDLKFNLRDMCIEMYPIYRPTVVMRGRAGEEDVRLNYRFLLEALNGNETFTLQLNGAYKPVRGRTVWGEFVLMPVKDTWRIN